MRPVSAEYREAIQLHRTQGVRNSMHAEVYFGLIDDTAKPDSTYTISTGLPYSDSENMYHSTQPITTSYATWEKDSFTLDSEQRFLPLDQPDPQGYISHDISDGMGGFSNTPRIDVEFATHHSVIGLSFMFDPLAGLPPKSIKVTTYDENGQLETRTIEGNVEYDLMAELALNDFTRMRIEFTTAAPYQRVHLLSLTFGVGYVYADADLLSVEHKRSTHPLSLSLPMSTISFSIFNADGRFDVDSYNSVVRFLMLGQRVTLRYGYDLTGFGDIEWFDAGVFQLKSWKTNGIEATFTAKDIFSALTETQYDKGVFDRSGHSISDLAAAVLEDAGVTDYDVSDAYARETATILPVPYDTHANCLQMLANFACSTLEQQPSGKVSMRQRGLASPREWGVTASPNGMPEAPLSNPHSAVTGSVEYATWELDFFTLDSDQVFLSSTNSTPQSGFVSNVFSPDLGAGVGVTIDFTRNATFGKMRVLFSVGGSVGSVRLLGERYGTEGYVYDRTFDVNGTELLVNDLFDDIEKLSVIVLDAPAQQRARILAVEVERPVYLSLTTDDVIGNATGTLMPACKDVVVPHTTVWYPSATQSEELMRATVTPGVLTEIKHSEVYFDTVATTETVGAAIVYQEHYAYTSYVQASGTTDEVEVVLKGGVYAKTAEGHNVMPLNDTGQDALIENPLINSSAQAGNVARWAHGYYTPRNQYEIETLGYPECDAGDYITYKGKPVTVLENSITFRSGAMRGKMKMRGE